jgi:hypothetical protein
MGAIVTGSTYFIANRILWAAGLFIAPVVAAVSGSVIVGMVVLSVLVLLAVLVFDTDRGWWSDEVRSLPQDKDRSRREVRLLTASAAVGLVLGLVAAFLLG